MLNEYVTQVSGLQVSSIFSIRVTRKRYRLESGAWAQAIFHTCAMLESGTNAYYTEELLDKLGTRVVAPELEVTTIAQTRMLVKSTAVILFVSDIDDAQEPCCISDVTEVNIDLSGLLKRVEL